MMAELSPKRKLSHAGILAIGGFCIDPNYEGRLIIGLFNFSSTKFPLIPGKKVIAATFYELGEVELGDFPDPGAPLDDFPDELIQIMQRYVPVSLASLNLSLEKMRLELDTFRNEIRSHDDWYKRFEQSLDRHDKQIGELLQGLNAEKEVRQLSHDKFVDQINTERESRLTQIHKLDRILAWLRGGVVVSALVVTAILIPLLVAWLKKQFGL